LKKALHSGAAELRQEIDSAKKETQGYIADMHSEMGTFLKAKKREKNEFVLEITACVKKIDELTKRMGEVEQSLVAMATIMACQVESTSLELEYQK